MGVCKCGKRNWNYGPYECGECMEIVKEQHLSELYDVRGWVKDSGYSKAQVLIDLIEKEIEEIK